MWHTKRVAFIATLMCAGVAHADDLNLMNGGSALPNILFLFDSSGSMNNQICEDLSSGACPASSLVAAAAPNNSTICKSPALAALTAATPSGGAATTYQAPYAANGTSFSATRYPIYDPRTSGTTADDKYPTASTYSHGWNKDWTQLSLGTGTTTQAQIDSAIAAVCNKISDCNQLARCVYSLRTQGYFWEPSGNPCGAGNPYATSCGSAPFVPVTGATIYQGPPTPVCACTTAPCDDNSCNAPPVATCGNRPVITTRSPAICSSCANAGSEGSGFQCGCGAQIKNGVSFGTNGWVGNNAIVGNNSILGNGDWIGNGTNLWNGSVLGNNVYIGDNTATQPNQIFGDGVWIGDHVAMQPGQTIGPGTCLGNGVTISPGAVIGTGAIIGSNVTILNNAVIGAGAVIGDGVIIGNGQIVPPGNNIPSTGVNVGQTVLPVFLGDFLNFYPPKGVSLVKVFTDTVANMPSDARIGVSDFSDAAGAGTVAYGIKPDCTTSNGSACTDGTPTTTCFNGSDAALKTYLYSTLSFSAATPLAKALDNASNYFTTTSGTSPPICNTGGCLPNNFVVLVTDGFPSGDATSASGVPFSSSKLAGLSDGYYATNGSFLDDVAKGMTQIEFRPDLAGTHHAVSYVVSFGLLDAVDPNKCVGLLSQTAAAGAGQCYPASSAASLRSALASIVGSIDTRSKAFASTAVQSTRNQGGESADMAMFRADARGPTWLGHLFSFRLWDEAIDGQYSGGSSTIKNEVFTVDANSDRIQFDGSGNLLSKPFWDAALCLAGDVAGTKGAVTPEDPNNLSIDSCRRDASESASRPRKIFTKVAPSTAGTLDDFTVANVTALTPLLGAVSSAVATKVIQFFRGFDITDVSLRGSILPLLERNLSNLGQSSGWWKLGDIFHSTPIIVSAPSEFSVYSFGKTGSAYDSFRTANKSRSRVVIAGANDGMIHAFHAGTAKTGNNPATPVTEPSTNIYYDQGTGEELWAMVPNHMLPKMSTLLACANDTSSPCTITKTHDWFVDSTAQVRDAYLGTGTAANLANPANSGQWVTMMVIGDRDGGTKFTALDITDPGTPKFMWEFPQASQIGTGATQRAEAGGLSWSESYPNPAPIFPVQFADSVSGTPYLRWVAVLNGGFSRTQTAGRGIYMVDAKTGALLWKFEYASTGENANMLYSFAAPVAGVPGLQNAIGKLVAVDTGGQVWSFDLSQPGVLSGGLAQWTGQRIFTAAAATSTGAAYGSAPLVTNSKLMASGYPYLPMFNIAATAFDTNGDTWVYVGTGDRDMLARPSTAYSSTLTLDAPILDIVCNAGNYTSTAYANRLYGLKLERKVSSRPNTEDDLTNLTLSGSPGQVGRAADTTKPGWFLILRPAEKVNNGADVFNKVVYFTSYAPVCAASTSSCQSSTGTGRLYALDYLKGTPVMTLGNGAVNGTQFSASLSSADTSQVTGSGLPSAPMVSLGVANGTQSGSLLVTSSDNPSPSVVSAPTPDSLASTVFSFEIPRTLHDTLQSFGSNH